MKFRKKPVVVEAVQYAKLSGQDNPFATVGGVPIWLSRAYDNGTIYPKGKTDDGFYCLVIETLEGPMTVKPLDWIIRGIKDELYPCKPDIFDATYEAVE
jgi:hypothetical protein